MAVFETRAAIAKAAVTALLRVDEGRAGDGKNGRRGDYGLEHGHPPQMSWCENNEPAPRRSKLNFGQREVLTGLQLRNLRRNL
jgi:hypothetical protein